MTVAEKKSDSFSLIRKIPDRDTMELTIFGSSYTSVKEALYRVQHIESLLKEQGLALADKLIARKDYDDLVVKLGPDHFRKIEQDEDLILADMQRYLRIVAALKWCEEARNSSTLYGRMVGAAERGRALPFSGEMGDIWEKSVHELGKTPIEYQERA